MQIDFVESLFCFTFSTLYAVESSTFASQRWHSNLSSCWYSSNNLSDRPSEFENQRNKTSVGSYHLDGRLFVFRSVVEEICVVGIRVRIRVVVLGRKGGIREVVCTG